MNIKADTIGRTIALVIALANQILAIFGKEALPFADSEIYQLVSLIATIVTSGMAWWKNNSFTKPAIEADTYLKEVRKYG